MKWFDLFPLDWRTGATFVHDWFALGIWVAVIGHILFAVKRRRRARQHDRRHRARGMGAHEGTPLVRGAAVLTSAAWTPTPRSPPPATTSPAPDTSSRISCASPASAPTRRTTTTSTRAATRSPTSCVTPASTTCASCGSTAVTPTSSASGRIDPAPPRCCSTRTTTCSRPATSTGGRPIRSNRSSATAGSSAAAAPTTRRVRSRTSPRCGPGSTPPASSPATSRSWSRARRRSAPPASPASSTAHAEALRADVLLLADAGNWSVGTPGLTYSLRGLAGVDVRVRALDGPVHSGMAGGVVPDPVLGLARMLATLVDEHGDAAFDGCWDDYAAPDAAERARIAALPEHVDGLRRAWGVRDGVQLAGDPSISVFERLWLRPAVTVIGIDGHPIAGSSNQIVAEAAARVSVRVGRGQDPARLNDALRRHLERRVPLGLEVTVDRARRGARLAHRPDRLGVRRRDTGVARRLRRRPGVHGCRRHHPVRRAVRRRVRRHPGPAARSRRSGQPHPRGRREPPPRRLAQADRRARCCCSPNSRSTPRTRR